MVPEMCDDGGCSRRICIGNRGGIKVCQIDEADAVLLMEQYGIDRVPSFLAFIKGKVTGALTGVVLREVLESWF